MSRTGYFKSLVKWYEPSMKCLTVFLLFVTSAFLFSACTLQKRRYTKGFYFSVAKHAKQDHPTMQKPAAKVPMAPALREVKADSKQSENNNHSEKTISAEIKIKRPEVTRRIVSVFNSETNSLHFKDLRSLEKKKDTGHRRSASYRYLLYYLFGFLLLMLGIWIAASSLPLGIIVGCVGGILLLIGSVLEIIEIIRALRKISKKKLAILFILTLIVMFFFYYYMLNL